MGSERLVLKTALRPHGVQSRKEAVGGHAREKELRGNGKLIKSLAKSNFRLSFSYV